MRNSQGHTVVPVEVAAKGLGDAGDVVISDELWNSLIPSEAVRAVGSVEVPLKELPEAELAMVTALEAQGHLVPIRRHMPGN